MAARKPTEDAVLVEDAEARTESLLPEAMRTQLASDAWKERLAGVQSLQTFLERTFRGFRRARPFRALRAWETICDRPSVTCVG